MQNFQNYNEIKKLVQSDFDKMSDFLHKTASLAGEYDAVFRQKIDIFLNQSSKQLRSCLIFLFSRLLYDEVDENTIKLAGAVEIIHNATLIHDDIIDNAEIRRGKTSLHKIYGNRLSIIAGDLLLSSAIKILTTIKVPAIIDAFADCLENLCKGEIKQYFSERKTPTIESYIQKSEAKTASLFVASLSSLAVINCSPYKKDLENFARHFGIAFQIKDDLKNITDEQDLKPLLTDLNNGIYTAPIIFAFGENENLSEKTTEEILSQATKEENILKTKQLIEQHANKAITSIENLPHDTYYNAIVSLCKNLYK